MISTDVSFLSLPIHGRGAAENPPNRFDPIVLDPETEHGRAHDDPEVHPTTQYFRDATRTILAHNDSPDVGFEFSINPYRGCEHGWAFCQFPRDTSNGRRRGNQSVVLRKFRARPAIYTVCTADGAGRRVSLMTGDSLTWFLFWLGIGFAILINLATGLVLSIVFFTLQMRRDLQRELDEIWLLAKRATDAVQRARSKPNGHAEAEYRWIDLENEWLRARRTFRFALTDEKWDQLRGAIYAIRDLLVFNSHEKYERFLKLHPLMATDSTGTYEKPNAIDYGTWADKNELPKEKALYDAFLLDREQVNQKIEYLLEFNSELIRQNVPPEQAPSLPSELEQAWHFTYLFPRAWKWFFTELLFSFWKSYREQLKESEEQRRR